MSIKPDGHLSARSEYQYYYFNKDKKIMPFSQNGEVFSDVQLQESTYYLKGLSGVMIPAKEFESLESYEKKGYNSGLRLFGKECRRLSILSPLFSRVLNEDGTIKSPFLGLFNEMSKSSRAEFNKGCNDYK
jgi:hypothetical protein